MLDFFRRYQKGFFIGITVVIVISFSFFGTYGAMSGRGGEVKDEFIGAAVDGSQMSKNEIDRMVRFLATDRSDTDPEQGMMANVFNDGVIRKDLLGTGIGQMLAEAYFDAIVPDVEERLEKAKKYRPYKHPQADFVAAESMWSQFVPQINDDLRALRESTDPQKGFALLASLYLAESKCPPALMRRFLDYQQNQHHWLQKDPTIARGDFALFHFHSIEEWFGRGFVELACQFIHNAALHAKAKGYKVSAEEARAELLRNGFETIRARQEEDVSGEMLTKVWRHQLATLHLDDKAAVAIWQKVMLFRRLFGEVGSSIVLDRLTYDNYHEFASQSCEVEMFTLPQSLTFANLRDVFALQRYIELTAVDTPTLALPKKSVPLAVLEKKVPELLQRRYRLDFCSVDKAVTSLDVGLREMWDWQVDNWDLLCAEFKALSPVAEGERLAALDKVAPELRKNIDAFTRERIADGHPEWIIDALADAETREKEVVLPLRGECTDLPGISDTGALIALLDEGKSLAQYTQDGKHFYRIDVKEKCGGLELMPFADAARRGVMDRLLDSHLEKEYVAVRTKTPGPFKAGEGWKPFAKVKDDVGRQVYAEVLKAIEKEYRKAGGKLEKATLQQEGSFYARHRLYSVMEEALARAAKGEKVAGEGQWAIQKEVREVKRNEPDMWRDDRFRGMRHEPGAWTCGRLFALREGEFSDVIIDPRGEVSFCQVLKKGDSHAKAVVKDVEEGQRLIADDAKRNFMLEILDTLKERDCIHIERRHQ